MQSRAHRLDLHISDGKSQKDRLLPALKKDYFNVAEMHFHTLLALTVEYARVMKFYNLENRESGTWEHFFSRDETVIIATILAVDPDKLISVAGISDMVGTDNELVQLLRAIPAKQISQHMIAAYGALSILDKWLQLLAYTRNSLGVELRKVVESVIIGLGKDIAVFESYLPRDPLNRSLKEFFSSDLNTLMPSKDNPKDETKLSHANATTDISDPIPIRSSFYAFVKAIEMVQSSAKRSLSASLVSQDHEPAAGLLIAFLQLFQKLHHKINHFTLDYIDFYYGQMLKARPQSFAPDHVYLVVSPSRNSHTVLIPKGTEFLAGQDESKRDIVYAAVDDVVINDAVVSSSHTLFFERDPLDFPENKLCESVVLNDRTDEVCRQFATGGWLNDVPTAVEANSLDEDNSRSYPLFGAPKKVEDAILTQYARFGFAVASKVLRLQEGRRTICIQLQFAGKPEMSLEQWIEKIASVMQPVGNSGVATFIQKQQAFLKIFRDMFVVSLSTKDGWQELAEYLPSYSGVDEQQKKNRLVITFFLPEDFPAVISYDREIHGDGYETLLPVVRMILNPRSYLYSYGILSKLKLARIRIDVAVEGCRMLQLYNNIGQLSSLTPFMPFGPIPETGSYFIVGCAETVGKQLSDFNIDVQWGGLPAGIGGFKTYYQSYGTFDDTDFRVSTSILANGKWLPESEKEMAVHSLFRIKAGLGGGSELSEHSELPCTALISNWSYNDSLGLSTEFNYKPRTKKGFFKFTLIAPKQAFGHRDYPTALANALTFNAKQKYAKFLKKLPNLPYTPVITSISADYQASVNIVLGKEEAGCSPAMQERMVHLHPLGWEDVTMRTNQAYHLLPQYAYSGNLFIGLNGLAGGGVVTLYFHLRENSLPIEHAVMQQMQWFYLVHNRWLPLSTKDIIMDSTQRFMKAGIVTLSIPADISQENTILPDGLSWLRVSSEQDLEKYCSLYSIYTQALEASRYLQEDAVLCGDIRLPVGAISRLRKSIPGIGGIRQIQPSFGGHPAEDHNHLRIRISERLKHKQRALLPVDYELLILEQFPQIYKVKCFPGMNPDFATEQRFNPGHLLIVVLPYLAMDVINADKPLLSGYLINEVKSFISRYAPSFAAIHVINPIYEVIQVRCTVKLKNPLLAGMCLAHLNQAISDFLSPWNETIGYTRHFGWIVSKHDIESFIQNLDYIDRVTGLSILRIAPMGEGFYDFLDSANKLETFEVRDIIPTYPWSVVAPIQQHYIEHDDRFGSIEPRIAGIGKLEIGSTFIISDDKWRKKIEKH